MRSLLMSCCLLWLTACGAKAPDIKLENAKITDPIGGRDIALGGITLTAIGEDLQLLEVTSPAAERIEIHDSIKSDAGRVQMRRLNELTVDAGTRLELGTGGAHLMIFGFDEKLVPGDTADLTLRFTQGTGPEQTRTVTAIITELGDETDTHAGHGS